MTHARAHERAPWRIIAAVTATMILAGMAVFTPTTASYAADFGDSAITGVTISPSNISHLGTGRVDFTWVAPAGAAPGDIFSLTLPDELRPAGTRDIQLLDPLTGELAAVGRWSGKEAVFTFDDYLLTHLAVSGSGYFSVKWDHSVTGTGAATYTDVQIGGQSVGTISKGAQVDVPPSPTRPASKLGLWDSAAQTSVRWHLRFPGDAAAELAGPVTVEDTIDADAGFTFDCANTDLRLDTSRAPVNPGGEARFIDPAAAPNVASYSCTTTSITLAISTIPAGWFYTLIARPVSTDPDRDSFQNTAVFDWPALAGEKVPAAAELRRDDAGGVAIGTAEVSVGDLVWEDLDRDGLQDAGEPGIPGAVVALVRVGADGVATPVLNAAGLPVTATTDASGLYLFDGLPALAPGEHYRVTISPTQPALAPFAVTTSGAGDDALDSSAAETFADTIGDLTIPGASDLTLDFGFVRIPPTNPVPPVVAPPAVAPPMALPLTPSPDGTPGSALPGTAPLPRSTPDALALSGSEDRTALLGSGAALALLFGALLVLRARRASSSR